MAVTATELTAGGSDTDDTTYVTASITPSSNRLVLLGVFSRLAGASPSTISSITGNGLTWVQVGTVVTSINWRLSVYRAMGETPSAGTITIVWNDTVSNCLWSVVELSGVPFTGANGADAVVQSATNSSSNTTSLTVTLAAFSSANNATYGFFTHNAEDTTDIDPGAGFTTLHRMQTTTVASEGLAEFRVDNDTSVDASSSSAAPSDWAGLAIEVKEAASAIAWIRG